MENAIKNDVKSNSAIVAAKKEAAKSFFLPKRLREKYNVTTDNYGNILISLKNNT